MKPAGLSLDSHTNFTRKIMFVALFTAGCATRLLAKPLPTGVIVTIKLSPVIQNYVGVSNRHDVNPFLPAFQTMLLVSDEKETLRGKEAIKDWIVKRMDKYEFY
jgi:hypothetical protein